MDWIANMPGPQFLGLYAAVIVATLAAACIFVRSSGRDDGVEPLVSTSPDPYEMAYLRGGDAEVGKLLLIELARRGYVQERMGTALRGGKVYLRQTDGHAGAALLPAAQRQVFELIGKKETPLVLLVRTRAFRAAVADAMRGFKDKLLQEGLVVSPAKRLQAFLFSAALIFGLGGYKLAVALAKGRYNVGFLVIFFALSMIALWAVVNTRLTWRGGKYFRGTQEAYRPATSTVVGAGRHGDMLLHVGLFGAPILLGTAASSYATMLGLDPNRRYGASGCGSGCGVSTSDSSGGGDGGGGGGGCGGGCGGCGGG